MAAETEFTFSVPEELEKELERVQRLFYPQCTRQEMLLDLIGRGIKNAGQGTPAEASPPPGAPETSSIP